MENLLNNVIKDRKFRIVFLSICIFSLVAHGFFYFNLFYVHDSLYSFGMTRKNVLGIITMGRYIQPAILWFCNSVPLPTLTGVVDILCLVFSTYFIVKMFTIENKLSIVLISAILVVNSTITLLNASYIAYSLCYHISLLLSVFGAYIVRNHRRYLIVGIVLWVVSLGVYQSYSSVAIVILMLLVIKDILNKYDVKNELRNITTYAFSFLCSLVVYLLVWKFLLIILGISATNNNNFSTAGNFEGIGDILSCFIKASGKTVISFFYNDTQHPFIVGVANIAFSIAMIILLVILVKYKKLSNMRILSLLLIFFFVPFAMNYTSFLGHGVFHRLMIYAVNLVYVFGLILADELNVQIGNRLVRVMKKLMIVCIVIVVFDGCIYSNSVYVYRNLVYQNTNLVMNRVVDRIEQVDEYIPGETPVLFIGKISNSLIAPSYDEFDKNGVGLDGVTSVTYYGTYQQYFNNVMRYPICVYKDRNKEIASREEVSSMSAFPKSNCCRMVDGILVVKLSE